jgi:hypothetical protein
MNDQEKKFINERYYKTPFSDAVYFLTEEEARFATALVINSKQDGCFML